MLIPALDLINGQIVRLKQGDFNEKTVFDLDPIKRVQEYSNTGAKMIHIVDLDGAKDPSHRQLDLVAKIVAASSTPIQVGGGIRTYEDIENLINLGVSRVVVGSAAIKDVDFGHRVLSDFGPEKICMALDVKITDQPYVATHGWLEVSNATVYDLIDEFLVSKLHYVLVTDISKDGMMAGPNVGLYADLAKRYPQIEVIASGGISKLDDIANLRQHGVQSMVLGRSLLSGAFTLAEALALC